MCLCQHVQTIACCHWFQLINSLCESRFHQQPKHLKDPSERTRSAQICLCFLSSLAQPIQMWAAARGKTSWSIADKGSQTGSAGTKLRIFLEGDKFQAWEKCWGVCFGWWVDALSFPTGKHTHLCTNPHTHTKTSLMNPESYVPLMTCLNSFAIKFGTCPKYPWLPGDGNHAGLFLQHHH